MRKLYIAFVRDNASIKDKILKRYQMNCLVDSGVEIEIRTFSMVVDRYFRSKSWDKNQKTTGAW